MDVAAALTESAAIADFDRLDVEHLWCQIDDRVVMWRRRHAAKHVA